MTQKQNAKSGGGFSGNDSILKILAIDTSTSMATAAITVDEKIVAESTFSTDRTLSVRLIPEIERMLSFAGIEMDDIDLFAASIGPGSFTGVRGGVATIQGLALATCKPCVGFSSLAMLAMNFPFSAYPVCPLLDARKSEVYAALYSPFDHAPAGLISDCVMLPELLIKQVSSATDQPVIFAGDGALRYRELIAERMGNRAVFPSFPLNTAHAANGAVLALNMFQRGETYEPSRLLPAYLRASDAELMKAKAV